MVVTAVSTLSAIICQSVCQALGYLANLPLRHAAAAAADVWHSDDEDEQRASALIESTAMINPS